MFVLGFAHCTVCYRRRQLLLVSERALYLESCPKRKPDDPTAFISALGITGVACEGNNL